jgi:hypothetical protein|tara:strand:+ start:383 stop:1108 length:726 start_codon:yes stop_codon:yes gene_type:complete
MGTLTGANLISRIQDSLQDTTGVRWTEAELLRYINDAQREVVNFKPQASADHSNVQLATGTEQSIPDVALSLIKVVRNMSATGGSATGKKSIRLVDEDILNSIEPDWHDPTVTGDAAHGSVIKHYIFDPDDPRRFYVYPGVKSGSNAYVELITSRSPTDLSATSSTIYIDDIYGNALVDYVLFRCYMKDSEFAGNAQRASQHYQLFLNSVSSGISSKNLINPNFDRNGQNIAPPPVQGLGV